MDQTITGAPGAPPPGGIELLTQDEVARALKINKRTVQRMMAAGQFAPHVLGDRRRPRWRPEDVKAWLERRLRSGRRRRAG